MKDAADRRKHLIAVVAIVGGGGIVVFFLAKGSGGSVRATTPRASASARRGTIAGAAPHSLNFGPNPAQPQLDAAILSAREAALGMFDQSSVAERSSQEQYQLGLDQDSTAKAIAFNTNATSLKQTGIETTAEQAIAQEEAQAQLQAVQAQTSAYTTVQQGQQSNSLWESIIGGISSIFPFLGFNRTTSSPIAYGSPSIPATQYALPDPVDPWAA